MTREQRYELFTESIILNEKDIELNLDKFESGKSNVLLVTGLSGGGKSTKASQLSSKYKAEVIELDIFESNKGYTDSNLKQAGECFVEYFTSTKEGKEFREKSLNNDLPRGNELIKYIYNFSKWLVRWCKKQKNKKYIIEGVQIYSIWDFDEVKSLPIIIIGSSLTTSIHRRLKRDGKEGKVMDILKYYWGENKQFSEFKKKMK